MPKRPPGRTAPTAPSPDPRFLLAALVVAALFGVFRLGFFADDFIFLDAARRKPLSELLLGWHGVWPWYRPLARELFFAVADAFRAYAAPFAHAVSLIALWLAAVALQRVVARRMSQQAAAITVALFVCHSLTFLLVGWLSGFQDILAVTLALWAVQSNQRGRVGWASACAGLATLAKESGFLAFVLLAIDVSLGERRRPNRREWIGWTASFVAAAGLHVLARATWPARGGAPPVPESESGILPALIHALPWSVPPGPADTAAWISGSLAAALVLVLLRSTVRAKLASAPAWMFVTAAFLVSLTPALAPMVIIHSPLRTHFLFAALPWACALVGAWAARWVPGPAIRVAVPLLCGACVWSSFPRPVDLDAPGGWNAGPLDWAEAQRMEARTRRLESDIRTLLSARPESLVVGFLSVPNGSLIQTGDGPALRIVLDDPTVTGVWVRDIPDRVLNDPRSPLILLDYDSVERHRLVALAPDDPSMLPRACSALLAGRVPVARALARYAARADSASALPRYLVAAAALADEGPRGFAQALFAARFDAATSLRASEVLPPRMARALDLAFETPLDAAAHVQAADSLAAARAPILEALELFVAVRLDSTRTADALRLSRLIARAGPTHDDRDATP